jgi:AcrR family transcriptional regulator
MIRPIRGTAIVNFMDRRQAEVRRDEILRAAAHVVSQRGFPRTRVVDVAQLLGISSGLVFYHFDSKERLLSEAFSAASERDLAQLRELIADATTHLDRLRRAVRLYQPTGDAEGWSRDIDAWAEGLHSEEIREACRRNDARWRAAFQGLITDGIAAGEFPPVDAQEAAVRITVALDGLAVASQVRGTVSRERAARWAAEQVAAIVGIPAERMLTDQRAAPVEIDLGTGTVRSVP